MKTKLTCEVICNTKIQEDVAISAGNREYVFRRNGNGFIQAVDIIEEVTRPEEFFGGGIELEGETFVMKILYDVEQNKSLIEAFQELESLMAYEHHLSRIKWDWPQRELLEVPPEDLVKIGISGFAWPGTKPADKSIGRPELEKIVGQVGKYSPLTVLMSFFREGKHDFMNSRNVNAFHNFYFVLEGLYGNGKSKNADVMNEFLTNKDSVRAFTWAVGQLKAERKENFQKLLKHLKDRNLPTTIEELIKRVVSTRGLLHHYNMKSSIAQGTPFTHRAYEAWAEYLLLTCIRAIEQEKEKLDQINTALSENLGASPEE